MSPSVESDTGKLFGSLWPRLSDIQFQDSVDLFRKRADANSFDLDIINGARCLDAGCGSGRYSVAMALCGADHIDALDISESGLSHARQRCSSFESINFVQGSVLDIPFNDSTTSRS